MHSCNSWFVQVRTTINTSIDVYGTSTRNRAPNAEGMPKFMKYYTAMESRCGKDILGYSTLPLYR
jgi:hypothetical protein